MRSRNVEECAAIPLNARRHTDKMSVFNFHPVIKAALALHVEQAILRLDPNRYKQEPQYVGALLGKLDAVIYDGPHGYLELKATSVDDRGRGSAESLSGADFAITAVIGKGPPQVKKAVLGQAKKGTVENLAPAERTRLSGQIAKLRRWTRHYVVMETPSAPGQTVGIRRSKPSSPSQQHEPQTLDDYLEQLARCSHGDKRSSFVTSVQDASLPELKVIFRGG